MKNLAIIPARCGSKGLKDKNIKPLCGRPLISYSIEAARESGLFDTVMVSTDSERYASIAREYGAEVPFLRNECSSTDKASSWSVVAEVLSEYEKLGKYFDTFCLLQPTTPLRNADDISNAYKLLEEKPCSAVVSVCEAEHSLSLYNTLPEDHSFVGFLSKPAQYARQMNETDYRLNGAVYVSRLTHFRTHKYIYDVDCFATIMPQSRSIDIDCETDFVIANALMEYRGLE